MINRGYGHIHMIFEAIPGTVHWGGGVEDKSCGGGATAPPLHPIATYLLRVSENLAHAETNARMSGYLYKSSQTN